MKKPSVLVGLSGGVDSAVAALLLKKQGYQVVGAFMRNFSENKNKLTGECHWTEDKRDAEKIAALLEIPLLTFNFENEYKRDVIDPMFKAYARNLTPNPDANCNRYIKFPLLWHEAKKRGIEFIATGHYARIVKKGTKWQLQQAQDKEKDQTYFLYKLKQADLQHTLLPIGNYTKSEVRAIAKKNKIPVYDKRGSRGICFVGKQDMKSFLKQRIKEKTGKITDAEGRIVGTHPGTIFFTIGERIGEHAGVKLQLPRELASTKLFVAQKNASTNTIIATPADHILLKRTQFSIKKVNLLDKVPSKVLVRVRHRGELIPAKIKRTKNRLVVTLSKPTIIAPGQSAVLYNKSQVIAGGEIN